MQHRTVQDLMTHDVIHVRAGTGFKELVQKLTDNDITAMPVVDERNCPIGVVSEADLLHGEAVRPDPEGRPAPGGREYNGPGRQTEDAGRLMSSPAVCAQPQWNVVEAARTMERYHIKRLPVVDESGKLVGLVSRSDLLRIFLRRDSAIREEIVYDILGRTLSLRPDAVQVTVSDGVVTLRGSIGQRALHTTLLRMCRAVDGVVAVRELAADTAHPPHHTSVQFLER
ncbi:CBS domain-containing protein [Streptomyces sp. NPDC087440]|uniref:CBS domain-containing protein n=1 Tax=Streptomyces sp. NPDC087440 TaxID=3365790 RepID=UPI00381B25F8